jgi:hypothetical protein
MYLPYIRGKQFELIGIRELFENYQDILAKKALISPIIEPVKDSSTLKTTLKSLLDKGVNFTYIINPQVGTFTDTEKILEVLKGVIETTNSTNYQIGIIFHRNIDHDAIISSLNKYEIVPALSIIHHTAFDDIEDILKLYQNYSISYHIVDLSLKRYIRNFDKDTRVELDDYFNSQERNADYSKIDESDFSEEHKYYKEEGFVGFSDYLTIGKEYSESGFLPYAVAIHLSYVDEKGRIKVKHFVSDSNDDTSDIAGKFSEALDKLINWCDKEPYDSVAIPFFREYHKEGHFPGLGMLKKLSLMNHIDLVLKLISK